MTRFTNGWSVSGATLLCLVLLSGCAASPGSVLTPGAGSASPRISTSPSVGPTTVAAPAVDRIVIDATQLLLLDADGETVETVPYSTPVDAAIATLTSALGASPTSISAPESHCWFAQVNTRWGEALQLDHGPEYPLAGDAKFEVYSSAAETPGGVAVETPQGFTVGESFAELVASDPKFQGPKGHLSVWFDERPKDTRTTASPPAIGAEAVAKDGLIFYLVAPVNEGDC